MPEQKKNVSQKRLTDAVDRSCTMMTKDGKKAKFDIMVLDESIVLGELQAIILEKYVNSTKKVGELHSFPEDTPVTNIH